MKTLQDLLQKKDFTTIEALITQNPQLLDEVNEQGQSGFMQIVYSFQSVLVQKALNLKTNFTLYEAAAAGKLEEVKKALATQPELLNTHSPDGFTAISLAAYLGKKEVVAYLIAQNADPNKAAKNASKVNALHAAVACNDADIVKLLLENGADANQPQTQGVSAIHSAVHRGNLAIVKLLVQHKVNVMAKTQDGKTALDFAEADGHLEVADYLRNLT